MSGATVILDIGSCWKNKDGCIKAVDLAKEVGASYLKFQLGTKSPNKELPFDYFVAAFEHGKSIGLDVISSVFDSDLFGKYLSLKPAYTKFAYSQMEKYEEQIISVKHGVPVVASCDIMTRHIPVAGVTKLYCVPSYPVQYELCFDGIFDKFDGFSDHTLGYKQTLRAVLSGAKIIEKHVRLDDCDDVPDSYFALTFAEVEKMINSYHSDFLSRMESCLH